MKIPWKLNGVWNSDIIQHILSIALEHNMIYRVVMVLY